MAQLTAQNRAEFQQVAVERFADAQALFALGRYKGAYYLAGYAVECALKACIAKLTQAGDFPPRNTNQSHYTPNLKTLLSTARLVDDLDIDKKRDARLDADWVRVSAWSEESRYNTSGTNQSDAALYLNAVQDAADATKGVSSWPQARW